MKIGDVVEYAIWADGRETPEVLAQFDIDIHIAMNRFAELHSVVLSPIAVVEKRPGEDRVPPVPPHVQGPNVRLIVAEAAVMAESRIKANSFLADLDAVDLERLRAVTRRACYGLKPDGTRRPLTDVEVDRTIEELGPIAAVDAIRKAMGSGLVH